MSQSTKKSGYPSFSAGPSVFDFTLLVEQSKQGS